MPASAEPTAMRSTPRSVGPAGGVIMSLFRPRSNFEADHFGHDENADAHPDEPAQAGHDQAIIDEEPADILRIDPPYHPEDDERQGTDDVSRSLGFGAHRPDLELHLPALAQHVGQVRQCFGQVAAGLALDRQRYDEELEFGRAQLVG